MAADDRRPRITAYLSIVGESLDFSVVSGIVGLEPSEARRRGEVPPGRRKPCPDTFWELRVETREHGIDGAVSAVLSEVSERREALMSYLASCAYSVHLQCTVDLYGDGVGLSLSSETIRMLADLGATFDIDVSDFRS